jgi:hypothetical protein
MRRGHNRLTAFCGMLVGILASGCIHGGRVAFSSLDGKKIVAAYRAEGRGSSHPDYYLIQTDRGLVLFERVPGGLGSLIKHHWREADEDHFAIWGELLDTRVPAFEFVIPADRTRKGKAFIYPEGTYSLLKINGRYRPETAIPNPIPSFWLVPKETIPSH